MNFKYNYIFCMPGTTFIGIDSVKRLGAEFKKRGMKKSLIITDEFMAKTDITLNIISNLNKYNIEAIVYEGVKPNPTMIQVSEALREFLVKECDSIISIGGGSPIDCAKAVKLTILEKKLLNEYRPLFAAVNTTAGTGSELTKFSIITDETKHYKLSIVDENIIPDIAVDDPMLMVKLPKTLTAATGMDALTHAIEAYVSVRNNYITDCTALKAIELIHKYLYRAFDKGEDIEAREGMVYAQYLAGMAFSNAGLGLVHAMAHQLGGFYNLPHGVCNAVLLPYVMKFNLETSHERYGQISRSIGLCHKGMPDKLAAEKLIRYVKSLSSSLKLPEKLKDLSVTFKDCTKLAEMTLKDPSLAMNPTKAQKDEITKIYENAFYGKLDI